MPDDPLRIRIAINSGIGTTRDISSPRRREFTVLGDVVNACSEDRVYGLRVGPDRLLARDPRSREEVLQRAVARDGHVAPPPGRNGSVRDHLTTLGSSRRIDDP